jgi:hypothetical protein
MDALVMPDADPSKGGRGPLGLALLGIVGVSSTLVAAPGAVAQGGGRIHRTMLESACADLQDQNVVVRDAETDEETTTTTSTVGQYSVENLEDSVYTARAWPSVPEAPSISERICPAVSTVAAEFTASALAQVRPAAGHVPPDDTPSIRVGVTLFANYSYQTEPEITDADGNTVHKSSFDVTRSYINITGQISHLVAFRLTPDITRESSLLTAADSVSSDSLVFRIKYAYGQINLDDWMTKGTWIRLGIQQTPWIDFEEGIYRYRFQGTVFAERVPLPTTMTSSDAGVSFHYNFPENYGDFHVGAYNGENYGRVEVNGQKGLELRATLRPFAAGAPELRGLRGHFVYYNDHYVSSAERRRIMGNATFEHKYVNAGFDYLNAQDQSTATASMISSNGYSVWATPRKPLNAGASWEALLRYDHWTPNTSATLAPPSTAPDPGSTLFKDQKQKRFIIGVAYWFPHQGSVSAALLVDYDAQMFDNITTSPVKVVAVHALINF